MISTSYNYNKKTLVYWQNRLEFSVQKNIKKENLLFQLEEITEPQVLITEDSKMSNITILKLDESIRKKIVTSFYIRGLQKFDKFKTLNPLNIQVINSSIRNSIRLNTSSNYRYKFRFIANSLLFSSAIKGDTNAIFIATNDLIDAQQILVNGKFIQSIGTIYTSEIENWSELKKQSHWINVKLTDIAIPIAAKHFAFGFETQDYNNLLKFEYSLINDEGKLIEFKDGETKVPALHFSIQVIL